MPRNSNGVYSLPAGTVATARTTISSAAYDAFLADVTAEITASVNVNGTAPMLAALNMGTNKINNVVDPTLAQDAATKNYVDLTRGQFRNRIVNGAFAVDQNKGGAVYSVPNGTNPVFTADRWAVQSGFVTVTAQRTAGVAPELYALQVSGAPSCSAMYVGQRISYLDCADLAGGSVVISLKTSNSLLTTVNWELSAPPTADTFPTSFIGSAGTVLGTGSWTVTGALASYNATATLPATAVKGLQLTLSVGAQTSGVWSLQDVQLEAGSVPTTFERRPYEVELGLCLRRLAVWAYNGSGSATVLGAGYATTGTAAYAFLPLPPQFAGPMANATLTTVGAFTFGGVTTTALTFAANSPVGGPLVLNVSVASGLGVGSNDLFTTVGTNSKILLQNEL